MRRVVAGLLLALVACGKQEGGAIDGPDPLHDKPIQLPPPELGLPPKAPAVDPEAVMISVPPPPFSKGIFPCSKCHVGSLRKPDTQPAVPHKTHLDQDLVCGDCHDPEETGTPAIPKIATCFECHEKLAEEPASVQNYFKAIRQADGSYLFPRRWKTADVRPAHAKHASKQVDCSQCHGEVSNQPTVKPPAVPLMQRCLDCHKERGAPSECAACHKEIREPKHRNIVLKHAEHQRGCFGCHNPDDRDTLRLANGDKISFEKSYLLCGQCHGTKLRDWKLGIHGKRTGMWDGRKEYLLCVHCHQNPHSPKFPLMTPQPPPVHPEDIK